MGHLARETDRMTIDLDTSTNIVLVRERWRYQWIVAPGLPAWTLAERRAFHHRVEAAILRGWNDRATIRVVGNSPFARSMAATKLSVRLDIEWVTTPHWQWLVTVKKIPPAEFDVSKVDWSQQRIWLDSNDLDWRHFGDGAAATRQLPVQHEYSHTLGNVLLNGHGDEYLDDSPYRADTRSMVNIGNELRVRHFDYVVSLLNGMVPDARFYVSSVR